MFLYKFLVSYKLTENCEFCKGYFSGIRVRERQQGSAMFVLNILVKIHIMIIISWFVH